MYRLIKPCHFFHFLKVSLNTTFKESFIMFKVWLTTIEIISTY